MASRIRGLAETVIGVPLARYYASVIESIETATGEDESVYLIRLAALAGSSRLGLLALTSSRCVLAARRRFRKQVITIDMPFETITGVSAKRRGERYLVMRVLLSNRPPVEIRLGRRVEDRDRVVSLLTNLTSETGVSQN
jgi:hypothetical protein